MEGLGFIHEKLDIKILILYILNHLPAAVDAQTLSDLVFCDNGIGYFDYADCLADLVDTAHITEEGGKYRIYNHFQQKKTEKETVAFLKKEYGIGGFSWTFADGGSGFVNFDGKGFSILYDFKDDLRYEKKLKWKDVGKRLEYLVRMDRYLTDAEREKMPAWINKQTESKPLPPPTPDQKPVCETGSTVYLENDQRFTVESIGQFDVHLRNEDFPLVGRAVSREQFQQLLDANPRNGGMMLSEQQRESLVQEQREQALS